METKIWKNNPQHFLDYSPWWTTLSHMTWQITGHDSQKVWFGVRTNWWYICYNLILFSCTQKAYGNQVRDRDVIIGITWNLFLIIFKNLLQISALHLALIKNYSQHISQFKNPPGCVNCSKYCLSRIYDSDNLGLLPQNRTREKQSPCVHVPPAWCLGEEGNAYSIYTGDSWYQLDAAGLHICSMSERAKIKLGGELKIKLGSQPGWKWWGSCMQ